MMNPFERAIHRWECGRNPVWVVMGTLAVVLAVVVVGKVSRGVCCAMHTPAKPELPPAH